MIPVSPPRFHKINLRVHEINNGSTKCMLLILALFILITGSFYFLGPLKFIQINQGNYSLFDLVTTHSLMQLTLTMIAASFQWIASLKCWELQFKDKVLLNTVCHRCKQLYLCSYQIK